MGNSLYFINHLNFYFILLYFYVYDQHIHAGNQARTVFASMKRLIESSVGISIWLKTKHFIWLITYSEAFSSGLAPSMFQGQY